jgi:hypothetical protein
VTRSVQRSDAHSRHKASHHDDHLVSNYDDSLLFQLFLPSIAAFYILFGWGGREGGEYSDGRNTLILISIVNYVLVHAYLHPVSFYTIHPETQKETRLQIILARACCRIYLTLQTDQFKNDLQMILMVNLKNLPRMDSGEIHQNQSCVHGSSVHQSSTHGELKAPFHQEAHTETQTIHQLDKQISA